MGSKKKRIIGTSGSAIAAAEKKLKREFPNTFKQWLIENNGRDLEWVTIFPVFDDRDPRKTWDSIVRNFEENWLAWLENFAEDKLDFSHLLPFGEFGTGDYYCFDYSKRREDGEVPVVKWSHETGETEARGADFSDFKKRVEAGEFEYD